MPHLVVSFDLARWLLKSITRVRHLAEPFRRLKARDRIRATTPGIQCWQNILSPCARNVVVITVRKYGDERGGASELYSEVGR